ELSPVRALYPDAASVRQLVRTVVERLEQVPGLDQAGAGTNLPIGEPLNYPVAVAGGELASVEFRAVTAGLLEAFQVPLLAGRRFDDREREGGAPVMLVNRAFVTGHMGLEGADPAMLAQALEQIVQMPVGADMAQFRIIGVVGDTRQHGPEHAPPAIVYLPFAQYPDALLTLLRDYMPLRFAARSQGEPGPALAAIAAAVAEVAPGQPLANLRPVPELLRASTDATRLNLRLIGSFAGLALLLAAVGLYAVIAVTVAGRRREFGIRNALGASRTGLLRLVLADGLCQVTAGLALGIVIALALLRLLQTQVVGLGGTDTFVVLVVAAVLVVTAVLACLGPALRTLRVQPAKILRAE
ncbi:MAG: FtsX-like permease family protein, partial [Lysobacterales bacterium]